jgi:hypothetical protein
VPFLITSAPLAAAAALPRMGSMMRKSPGFP